MNRKTVDEIASWRRNLVRALVPLYLVTIVGLPTLVASAPVLVAPAPWKWLLAAAAPVLFCLTYVTTCGVLSMFTRGAIIPGRFPRDLGHVVYGPRRLYALCWTSIYYFTPLYHAVLTIPLLKRFVFRMFGYKGSLNVTLYPDTWIRDLTLLDIEDGAYLSNRATIGTNMCLITGDVLVQAVRIESGAVIGHLSMLAPGAVVRARAEIGVGVAIGLNAEIGSEARVGPCCAIHHYARIGANADIGAQSYVGVKVLIAQGVRIPAGSVIPSRAVISIADQVSDLRAPDVTISTPRLREA